jgi:DNA-3-methyladenine glycosylase II
MKTASNLKPLTERTYRQGIFELTAKDRDLAGVVRKWGEPPFWTHATGFAGLVMAILAQQVSLESARAAFAKLEKAIGAVHPENLISLESDSLKAVGFSRQKASYVKGIASSMLDAGFNINQLHSMANDAAVKCLMALRGIGPWTAQTYLLFSLRRPDVWPSGDLALEKAVQELRGLPLSPSAAEVDQIAVFWKPWRAVAARILWHYYLCERGRKG